jgi:hypothetical protein
MYNGESAVKSFTVGGMGGNPFIGRLEKMIKIRSVPIFTRFYLYDVCNEGRGTKGPFPAGGES